MLDALQDVDFPAGKGELVQAAEDSGAPEEVVKALRAVPPVEYGNRDEVARSMRVDPASDLDLSAAQRAEQARRGGRPGQSQHLRDVPKPPVRGELGQSGSAPHGRVDTAAAFSPEGSPRPAGVSRQGDRASGVTVAPATARLGRRQESGGPRGTHSAGNRTCARRARSRVSCLWS
ncbi:DUF2795 domain-containing protein [Streptomyces sp. NPDC056580]|uniref:DUF2795 domain-containing protein n=1 Tax=Streptomyces sp. NPDC056580 TaxID=3345872 RepID=UPI0036887392